MKIRWANVQVVALLCASAVLHAAPTSSQVATLPTPSHRADIFRCDKLSCAMPSQGSYPHLIIGIFQSAATSGQSSQLFRDMRSRHLWASLPNDTSSFYAALQPVSITLVDGSSLPVLIGQDEAHASHFLPGDLVRYSPHRGKYEIPPTDPKARAYWAADGCVAILCRATDKACFSRYAQGVYRHDDGVQISPKTFKPLTKGVKIDPQSMLPNLVKNPSS